MVLELAIASVYLYSCCAPPSATIAPVSSATIVRGEGSICVLPAIAKIMAKIILGRINKNLESWIGKEQGVFRAGSSRIDNINILRIIID